MKVLSAIAGIIATNYQMSIEGAELFTAGLIEGLIGKDDLPEIQKCLKNTEALEQEITNAISDLSKGDLGDIIKAVQEIGQIVRELPADLDDCQNIQGDVTKITTWAKQFANPVTLVTKLTQNLLANWKTIQTDVTKTSTDYTAEQYEACGEDVADIVVLSLGKISHAEDIANLKALSAQNNMFLF